MWNIRLIIFCSLCLVVFALKPAGAETCMTAQCHSPISGLKNLHVPVKDGDCLSCHQSTGGKHPVSGGKSFKLDSEVPTLCDSCHDSKGKKKLVHVPVKEGECLSCHKPHGASGAHLLDASEDQTELCLGCHDAALIKHKYMHGPAAVGACSKCHDPHESDEKKLLREPVRKGCLACHADFAQTLKDATLVHPPVQNDPCTSCHDPHGSEVPFMLSQKMPDLCTKCHAALGKKLTVKVPHKPLQQSGGCGNCHSAHSSKAKGLLPFDEVTTCLSCHGKDNLGKPALRNMKKELDRKNLHGPIKKGECKACHDPHGSDHYRMLRGNYPAQLYAPYQEGLYDACLKCHEKNLLRYEETSLYTGFRNGKRNLHYLHVVNNRKGRTCRICHEPHASSGDKLISKEGSSFGDWKIPINFTMTATGGSCAPGCHREFKYDRNKPVSYR